MGYGDELIKNAAITQIPPADFNSAITASNWISMKNYGHATVVIMVGETAGGTMALTLDQATTKTGTGTKTLTYTRLYSSGQKLKFKKVNAIAFVLGETVTQTSGSSNTGEIVEIANDYLIVRNIANGSTWGNGNTITGGAGATATMVGTGQDEDIIVEKYAAVSSTFTIPATTFKTYVIEIEASSLDVANGYDHFQVDVADPSGSTIAGGLIILTKPGYRGVPMPSVLDTEKIVATYT